VTAAKLEVRQEEMVKVESAVVVPTAPSVTAPPPAVRVRPSTPAVVALTAEPLKLIKPFPVPAEVVIMAVAPSLIPPEAALKFTPAAVPVVILPFNVVRPDDVTVNDFNLPLPPPRTPKVTAPEPLVIIRALVSCASPLMVVVVPKLTAPLFVPVIVISPFNCIVEHPLKLTPVAVPVVIEPFNVTRPAVVMDSDSKAVLVPTAPRVTAPEVLLVMVSD